MSGTKTAVLWSSPPGVGRARRHRPVRSRPRRSGPGVDPAVLVPGEHDLLHVEARLVERDLLDEHFDVVATTRRPPLSDAMRPGIVGGDRQARIGELAQEPGEEAGAELDI